jgi:hypothetical protein
MEGNKDADASSETLGGGNVFRKKAFNFYSRNWHLASLLEHLQEFAKIYLANPVFCQLLKSYAK